MMKVFTLLFLSLVATTAFATMNFSDDFSTATVRTATGGTVANTKEVVYADYTAAPDAWHTCNSFGWQWKLKDAGGNPDQWITKNNNNQSVVSSIWRVLADNQETTGLMKLEFDYKFTDVDAWDEYFGVTVWGITSDGTPEWNGYILANGGGSVTDALSYNANDGEVTDGTQLFVKQSDNGDFTPDTGDWRSASFTVNLGTGYDYVLLGFAQGGPDTNVEGLYAGVDNVSFAPVPEPATMLLLGLGGLLLRKRR
jgi:hypothetical protein